MNVISLCGGLGNQMFQYALGTALRHGAAYELSWFDQWAVTPPGSRRRYGLSCFDCCPKIISPKGMRRLVDGTVWQRLLKLPYGLNTFHECPYGKYDPRVLDLRDSWVKGYFQCPAYFSSERERLLRDFTLRAPPRDGEWLRLMDDVRSSSSVSVHVRRGDYVQLQNVFPLCTLDYYYRAASLLRTRIGRDLRFFVFSDDCEWVRANLKLPGDQVVVDLSELRRDELDMVAMSKCRHNIIANSTYSWWGAWLNVSPGKIVVAPRDSFSADQSEIVPEEWERI